MLPPFHRSAFLIAWPLLSIPSQETSRAHIALPGRQGGGTKSRDKGVNVVDGLRCRTDERKRQIAAVSISSDGGGGANLTGGDQLHNKSSRRCDFDQPGHHGVYDFNIMVVALFDRIPIGHHQDDSTRGPKRSCESDMLGCVKLPQRDAARIQLEHSLSNMLSQRTRINHNSRYKLGSLLFQ